MILKLTCAAHSLTGASLIVCLLLITVLLKLMVPTRLELTSYDANHTTTTELSLLALLLLLKSKLLLLIRRTYPPTHTNHLEPIRFFDSPNSMLVSPNHSKLSKNVVNSRTAHTTLSSAISSWNHIFARWLNLTL